jgi:hypothetical protein
MINNSTNVTNATYYNPVNTTNIPDMGGMLGGLEGTVKDTLTSWGLDAFHTIFTLFVGFIVLIGIYHFFVTTTSKSSGIFKPIFYIVALIIILLGLGVI